MTFCSNGVWSKIRSRTGHEPRRETVKHDAVDPGHLADLGSVLLAPLLERLERAPHLAGVMDVGQLELGRQEVAVLDRHAGSVGGVGRGGMGGVAQQRDPSLAPLFQRLAVANLPTEEMVPWGLLDQRMKWPGEAAGALQRELAQVAGERDGGIKRLEHPPLIARLSVVANGGVAALGGAVVGDDRDRVGRVAEQVAGDEMELLVTDRLFAPELAAYGRVDAVGSDEDVSRDGLAVA